VSTAGGGEQPEKGRGKERRQEETPRKDQSRTPGKTTQKRGMGKVYHQGGNAVVKNDKLKTRKESKYRAGVGELIPEVKAETIHGRRTVNG